MIESMKASSQHLSCSHTRNMEQSISFGEQLQHIYEVFRKNHEGLPKPEILKLWMTNILKTAFNKYAWRYDRYRALFLVSRKYPAIRYVSQFDVNVMTHLSGFKSYLKKHQEKIGNWLFNPGTDK